MGHRTTMLPDDNDANRTHPASRVQRLFEEVRNSGQTLFKFDCFDAWHAIYTEFTLHIYVYLARTRQIQYGTDELISSLHSSNVKTFQTSRPFTETHAKKWCQRNDTPKHAICSASLHTRSIILQSIIVLGQQSALVHNSIKNKSHVVVKQ